MSKRFLCGGGLVLVALLAMCAETLVAAPPGWPSWRGPRGDGHSTETNLPTRWSNDSIKWSVALPGQGQSSPTIWGKRIFLTTALEKGKRRVVLCVDRETHKIVCLLYTSPSPRD